MIQNLYDNYVFLYIMGGLCGLGIFLKCFLLIAYNKLIKASESMTSTKKNWLKNMRLRFESSYQLQLGVNDVDTYVDKYVSKIKCGGLLLSTWENLSGQTIGLCLLTGSFAGILGFVYECGQGPVLFTFFTGAWTAIIVNIVDNVVNISAHKQMLRYNLIDYFENNLKVRMEQEVYHPEARRKYQRQYFSENVEDNQVASEDISYENNVAAGTEAVLASDLEARSILSKEFKSSNKDISSSLEQKEAKPSRKEEKQRRENEKFDAKAAKKVEKQEAKQARLDSIQAKKQAKQDRKQQHIDDKIAKKKAKDDIKIAREKATIEALLAKKNAKAEEKLAEKEGKENQRKLAQIEKERIENERKQKELENNKAYREKMRLKQEKEREAAKRRVEQQLLENSKEEDHKKQEEKNTAMMDKDEKMVKLEKLDKLEKIDKLEKLEKLEKLDKLENVQKNDLNEDQFDGIAEEEVIALTATSKEEDMLIEEVLKDFLF